MTTVGVLLTAQAAAGEGGGKGTGRDGRLRETSVVVWNGGRACRGLTGWSWHFMG